MRRVVVTGLGVVSPNGVGTPAFLKSLQQGASGLRLDSRLQELNFTCQVTGVPQVTDDALAVVLTSEQLRATNSCMRFAALAAIESWTDAGLLWRMGEQGPVTWDTAVCFGR